MRGSADHLRGIWRLTRTEVQEEVATISTHNGSTVRQAHNIRSRACVAKEAHIDPHGEHETWKHESITQAYHRLFDAAVAEYNARQSRPDRKISNYLANIRKDAKKHECYEMIIGVYGKECTDEQGKQIMKEFVQGWEKRNPNLELIGAYYHADEQGSPHVHLDYIPVAHGYTWGMETQTGLVRALEEMGYQKAGKETAQIRRERSENAELERICRTHGISVEHPDKEKLQHLATAEYQAQQDAARAEQEALRMAAGRDLVKLAVNLQEAEKKARGEGWLEASREYERVIGYFFDTWEDMVDKTKKAIQLEDLYWKGQDGVKDPDIITAGGNRYYRVDGQEITELALLRMYRETCAENGITDSANGFMLQELENAEQYLREELLR